jgi:hypothetical protein
LAAEPAKEKLTFDFTDGGNYVAAILKLKDTPDIKGVRLWLKNPSGSRVTCRYTDSTGQWGGANDGIVHGPPSQIALLVENSGHKELALEKRDTSVRE